MAEQRGIRRTPTGWQAYIRVRGQLRTKRFPRNTLIGDMKAWRDRVRVELRDAAARQLPDLPPALTDPLPRSLDGWCYIYFVQDGEAVKIGRAVDVKERLRKLQAAHHRPLTLLAVTLTHADLERAIHRRFAATRLQREWFRLDNELAAFITAVRTGENPATLLSPN